MSLLSHLLWYAVDQEIFVSQNFRVELFCVKFFRGFTVPTKIFLQENFDVYIYIQNGMRVQCCVCGCEVHLWMCSSLLELCVL